MLNSISLEKGFLKSIVEDENGANFNDVKKIIISESGVKIEWRNGEDNNSTEKKSKSLLETYWNKILMESPYWSEKIRRFSITYVNFQTKLDKIIKEIQNNNQTPDFEACIDEAIAALCDGKIDFGTMDDQKNENAKRNNMKAKEKTEKDEKDNGIVGEGEENEEKKEEGETIIELPKGFRLTKEEKDKKLSKEQAYALRLAETTVTPEEIIESEPETEDITPQTEDIPDPETIEQPETEDGMEDLVEDPFMDF